MVMRIPVSFNKRAAFKILEADIKAGHRNLFFFPVIEHVAWDGLHNPVFKRFDDPYFKVMQTAVGRLKMCLVLG